MEDCDIGDALFHAASDLSSIEIFQLLMAGFSTVNTQNLQPDILKIESYIYILDSTTVHTLL